MDNKFTILASKFIVLSCNIEISDSKNCKNSDKFIVCYCFSFENPTPHNKFIVLCCFCLDKIPATQHSEKQLSFE